jgi:cobalt-zinc-cadmium efflux system membrane fusion protein
MKRQRCAPWRRVAAIAAACAFAGACGGSKPAEPEARPAAAAPAPGATREVTFTTEQIQHGGVRWAPVTATAMTDLVETPGQLVPNGDRTERLSAPARARVVLVHVQAGDRVSKGQPLVTLQSPEAVAAGADLAKARAELTSREAATRYAKLARERAERLLELKAGSQQDVDRARADDELAQAAETQAQAEVKRAQTALAQLGASGVTGAVVLRAEIAGVVLSREVVPGSVVEAGAPLVTVTDPGTLWLEVAATEALASALQSGAAVRFTVPAFGAEPFDAHVQNVGAALDPETRTLTVRALVQNPGRRLRPAMFATVSIARGVPRAGVLVPAAAVQLLDNKTVVFVARPDGKGGAVFERRDVEVGTKVGEQTHILNGVKPGETVVTEGAFAVKSEFARSKMPSEG